MARPKKENHETAELILKCAREIFLEKGFAGTSINDIAETANIHKSLIYHHFGSKEHLWRMVKERIIEKTADMPVSSLNFQSSSLKEFLNSFVTFRFNVYAKNPEIIRMMAWQKLEKQAHTLAGVTNPKLTDIEVEIKRLQKAGEIRHDLKPEVIGYMITSLSSSGFVDRVAFLKTKKGQEDYLKLIIESLIKVLSPN